MTTSTSTTTNEHLEQIAAHVVTIVEAVEDQLPDNSDVSLTVAVNEIEAIAAEMAARIEEREAQLRLIAPVVSAALEMFQWEGSTDYPDGDLEVIKRRRAFRDALNHLDDLHYDELDFLDDFQPGDLPPTEGSN